MRTKVEYCKGKTKFDKKTATTAKNARMKEDHVALRIYPCPKCNGWHLTSQNPHREAIRLRKQKWRN